MEQPERKKRKTSRLVSELMADRLNSSDSSSSDTSDTEQPRFQVHSNSDEFKGRQKNVFDQLFALEDRHFKDREAWKQETPNSDEDEPKDDSGTQEVPSKKREHTGEFKQPPPPNQQKRKIPDYQLHPEKWKHYTLSDVPEEDMSEAANKRAAEKCILSKNSIVSSPLKKVIQIKELDVETESVKVESSSTAFHKPKYRPAQARNRHSSDSDEDESPSLAGTKEKRRKDRGYGTGGFGKWVMPQYEVGVKTARNVVKNDPMEVDSEEKVATSSKGGVMLTHLLDEG